MEDSEHSFVETLRAQRVCIVTNSRDIKLLELELTDSMRSKPLIITSDVYHDVFNMMAQIYSNSCPVVLTTQRDLNVILHMLGVAVYCYKVGPPTLSDEYIRLANLTLDSQMLKYDYEILDIQYVRDIPYSDWFNGRGSGRTNTEGFLRQMAIVNKMFVDYGVDELTTRIAFPSPNIPTTQIDGMSGKMNENRPVLFVAPRTVVKFRNDAEMLVSDRCIEYFDGLVFSENTDLICAFNIEYDLVTAEKLLGKPLDANICMRRMAYWEGRMKSRSLVTIKLEEVKNINAEKLDSKYAIMAGAPPCVIGGEYNNFTVMPFGTICHHTDEDAVKFMFDDALRGQILSKHMSKPYTARMTAWLGDQMMLIPRGNELRFRFAKNMDDITEGDGVVFISNSKFVVAEALKLPYEMVVTPVWRAFAYMMNKYTDKSPLDCNFRWSDLRYMRAIVHRDMMNNITYQNITYDDALLIKYYTLEAKKFRFMDTGWTYRMRMEALVALYQEGKYPDVLNGTLCVFASGSYTGILENRGRWMINVSGHLFNVMLCATHGWADIRIYFDQITANFNLVKGEPVIKSVVKEFWKEKFTSEPFDMKYPLWHSITDYLVAIYVYQRVANVYGIDASQELINYALGRVKTLMEKFPEFLHVRDRGQGDSSVLVRVDRVRGA